MGTGGWKFGPFASVEPCSARWLSDGQCLLATRSKPSQGELEKDLEEKLSPSAP